MISELNTDRMILRTITIKDYEDICEYGTDEQTGEFMLHWPKTRENIQQFIIQSEEALLCETPSRYKL